MAAYELSNPLAWLVTPPISELYALKSTTAKQSCRFSAVVINKLTADGCN